MDYSGQPTADQPGGVQQKPRKRSWWKIVWGIITGLSILGNLILFVLLIFFMAMFFLRFGGEDFYYEQTIREGPINRKIVVVNLEGIISDQTSQDIYKQLKRAGSDETVRAVILRINSPGGVASSSDRIYNDLKKFQKQSGKPVLAFMEGTAASGGYYSAAACEKIVAEPTVITGSIGVILNYFVLAELLEGKLGIEPVVIKSGEKKDWPSMFTKPSDEQIKYLQDKLIQPMFKRFVNIVADSRKDLTVEEVNALADGSIFNADEALDKKLIDNIGYIDDAIKETLKLAKIDSAKVVEYQKPFSLASFLGVKSDAIIKLDTDLLHKLSTPQIMYLWSIQ